MLHIPACTSLHARPCMHVPALHKDFVVEQLLESNYTCLDVKPYTVMQRLKRFGEPAHLALLQLSTVAYEPYSKAGFGMS